MKFSIRVALLSTIMFFAGPLAESRYVGKLPWTSNHLRSYYRGERSLTDVPSSTDSDLLNDTPPSVKLYNDRDHLAEKAIPHYVIEREQGLSELPRLYSENDHLAAKEVLPPHLRGGGPYASFEPFFTNTEPQFTPESNNEERLSHYGRTLD